MKKFEDTIRGFVKRQLGIELMAADNALEVQKWVQMFSNVKIEPEQAGALKLMFKDIEMSIRAIIWNEGELCEFSIRYQYSHPRGGFNGFENTYITNGYDVITSLDFGRFNNVFLLSLKPKQASELVQDNFKHLSNLVETTFDGDLSFYEFCEGISNIWDLKRMDSSLEKVKELIEDGFPFEGDDHFFDNIVSKDKGLEMVRKQINKWD